MKKIFVIIMLLLFAVGANGRSPLQAQDKTSPGAAIAEKMKFEKIKFKVPEVGKEVEKYVLPNGLTFLIMADKTLPLINIDALIRAGDVFEEKDKYGTSYLCAQNLRAGGTKNHAPDEIDKELDFRSIIIDFGAASDYTGASLNLLSKDLDVGLKLFADMLISPAFDKEKFNTEKTKFLDYIKRIEDDTMAYSKIKFAEFLYKDHPYGRFYDKETVNKITIDDLTAWHKKYFAPNNIIMAVSGDFDVEKMKQKLNEAFGGWEKKEIVFPKIEEPKESEKPAGRIINKKTTQSAIYLGHLGIKSDNPDYMPVSLMNYVFGGYFKSRLITEVRLKKGYTYSIRSSFDFPALYTGRFSVGFKTAVKNTKDALTLVMDMVKDLKEKGLTQDELKNVKEAYISKFVFGLTPSSKILYKLMTLEYYNLPRDFYANYIQDVEKVTIKDIQRCAKEYLHPEKIKIVIVGPEKDIKDDVNKIAPVEESK